jgi:predicted RNA-binding Zn-ribbon protein involved in translation (DUF1610 family)
VIEGDPNAVAARCPNCGAEYRAGCDTCADRGVVRQQKEFVERQAHE